MVDFNKRIQHEIILLEQHYGETFNSTYLYAEMNNLKDGVLNHCVYIPVSCDSVHNYMILFPKHYPFSACKLYILEYGNFEGMKEYLSYLLEIYRKISCFAIKRDIKFLMSELDF